MYHNSPFRYPGGKATIAAFLSKTIELNDLTGCSYFEPYAGGAGAGLHLLQEDSVSELRLNDQDPCLAAAWNAILNDTKRFVDAIHSVPLNVAEWMKQQDIFRRADTSNKFQLGFSAFYLNRCNRSGVLRGAAPIGGYAQKGKWKIDARFNRENLAKRVQKIGDRSEQIHMSNMDALDFLLKQVPHGNKRKHVFVYMDPPYYSNADRLYMNSYSDRDHRSLAHYVRRQRILKWAISYDDTEFIRKLYQSASISHISLKYSLQKKQKATELIIAPLHLQLPDSNTPDGTSEIATRSL